MILYPWKMAAEYADGYMATVTGNDEVDCMNKICNLIPKHGDPVWYGGCCDDNYIDGECIYNL